MARVVQNAGGVYGVKEAFTLGGRFHYVSWDSVGVGVNLRKNTKFNLQKSEILDAEIEPKKLHRWAGKSLVERDRRI